METRKRTCKCPKKAPKRRINVPIIWVIGGPGSGKGTQCALIVNKYGYVHISSGELIRGMITHDSTGSNTLAQTVGAGKLVSSEYVLELIRKEILKHLDNANGFLIDGYPRERQQGVLFEEIIGPVDIIIFFNASADVLKQRILHRAQTSGRLDDNVETFHTRLETYLNLKDDLVEGFKQKIRIIDADRPPEEIFKEIADFITHAYALLYSVQQNRPNST